MLLGNLRSGEPVFDRSPSFMHGSIRPFIRTILASIESCDMDFIVDEIDLGATIGESICVETKEGDAVFYAQRKGRRGLTRFVKDRLPEPTSTAVIILKESRDGYVLISGYLGKKSEPEPWDRNATKKSLEFWNTHALIYDESYEIIPGTEMVDCPW